MREEQEDFCFLDTNRMYWVCGQLEYLRGGASLTPFPFAVEDLFLIAIGLTFLGK